MDKDNHVTQTVDDSNIGVNEASVQQNNPYIRSELWRTRIKLIASVLFVFSLCYVVATTTLTVFYVRDHPLIWIVNVLCSLIVSTSSLAGICSALRKFSRKTQFKLSIVFAIGLVIFLSAQFFLAIAIPRFDCLLMPGYTTPTPSKPDECKFSFEAVLVYVTSAVCLVVFCLIWFCIFVRLRIMRLEDRIATQSESNVPTTKSPDIEMGEEIEFS
ncbi:ADRA2B [Acrasis kona]|uniref:ADRA2B n=1 Tax=Acrasis kona TaxID=1008807 RepID=A0AAW2ZCN8_9EUKA